MGDTLLYFVETDCRQTNMKKYELKITEIINDTSQLDYYMIQHASSVKY